jgi:hypothetical protein
MRLAFIAKDANGFGASDSGTPTNDERILPQIGMSVVTGLEDLYTLDRAVGPGRPRRYTGTSQSVASQRDRGIKPYPVCGPG